MGFFVTFWGTRGSIPTPGWQTRRYGGNTSCVEVRIGDALFICDAGTGLRELGVQLTKSTTAPIHAHMFLSHPHWDHIQGFPFFTPVYVPTNTFHIYGAQDDDHRIFQLLSGQMVSDYFPVDFSELGANVLPGEVGKSGIVIDGVSVTCARQIHPGGSYAYRFERDGVSVVYATDNELDLAIQNREETQANLLARRQIRKDVTDFWQGADLLIADGQYTDEEYPSKVGWGHARAHTVVDAAIAAGVKRLAIHHHDPMQSDDDVDEKIESCRARAQRWHSDIVIFAARERVELRLDGAGRI